MCDKKNVKKLIKVPLKPIRRGYNDFIFPSEYIDEEEYKRRKESDCTVRNISAAIIGILFLLMFIFASK